MKLIIMSDKEFYKCMKTIEELGYSVLDKLDFDLFEKSVDLMHTVCGMRGLKYAEQKSEQRVKEWEARLKELKAEKEEQK